MTAQVKIIKSNGTWGTQVDLGAEFADKVNKAVLYDAVKHNIMEQLKPKIVQRLIVLVKKFIVKREQVVLVTVLKELLFLLVVVLLLAPDPETMDISSIKRSESLL